MSLRVLSVALRQEEDVVHARQRARQIAASLGFERQDQTRIATAVSEIARNAYRYAGGGEVKFSIEGKRSPQMMAVEVSDPGPGIADVELILSGRYRSKTGMGLGIIGARRLMDRCSVRSAPGGTSVTMHKALPAGTAAFTLADLGRLVGELAGSEFGSASDEVAQQNTELIRTLGELRAHEEELIGVNRELEDTNRGVVALYAELEERADVLRRVDQTKTRFLSNMSHELRTPLNSVRALARLLLDRSDGPLTAEQEVQVGFISRAAADLTQMVDELLDLAKIESGKVDLRPVDFSVDDLFSALRGMLRPLLTDDAVALHLEPAGALPLLCADEGKLSQILRNLIANALKFTERGEVRVSAELDSEGGRMTFSVADTGIGIPPGEHERIFEEFAQVLGPLQARMKGTGLGLPLCRRLASLLGGSIAVRSSPGEGSTFSVTIPLRAAAPTGGPATLLVIDDDPASRYAIAKSCDAASYRVIEAADAADGLRMARERRPDVIVLDLHLPDRSGEDVLRELTRDPATQAIPVVIATGEALSAAQHERLRQFAAAVLRKSELGAQQLADILQSVQPAMPDPQQGAPS
jgi:signal transduction histidine kinase/ActR/RegA family two-component response regulator